MPKTNDTEKMAVVRSFADLPPFASEVEEREFWATHEMGDEILASAGPLERGELPLPRARTRPVAMRFDESTIQRLRTVADKRHNGYQSLAREFIVERLYEEEKREGLVPQRQEKRVVS